MKEFISEHWILIYGLFMFAMGEAVEYIKGKR